MARPDPIQYAERLYGAIRAANFSPISFLAFGNAIKEGVAMRNMPRIAAEPFMRVVGEMLDLEEEVAAAHDDIIDADVILASAGVAPAATAAPVESDAAATAADQAEPAPQAPAVAAAPVPETLAPTATNAFASPSRAAAKRRKGVEVGS
jgi:hypothetical protein